jgi:hypothetical protein
MSRTGKIARLPYGLRDELNVKIRDGKPGVEVVAWLNGEDETRQVLGRYFDGRPISEQNLTEWKAGGYQDWLRDNATREWMAEFIEQSDRLSDDAERADYWASVADYLSAPLAAELARCLKEISADSATSAKERLPTVLAITRAATQLRRADHSQKRASWQAWWAEQGRDDRMEEKQKEDDQKARTNLFIRDMYYQRDAEHVERMKARQRAERRMEKAAGSRRRKWLRRRPPVIPG